MRVARYIIAFLFAAFVVGFCFVLRRDQEPRKTRVAYLPVTTSLPFFVAEGKGFFSRNGVEVEAIRVEGAGEAINLLVSGRVEVAIGINMAGVFSATLTSPGKIDSFMPAVETIDHHYDYLLKTKGSPIVDAAGLRGKRLGIRQGPSDLLIGKLYLEKHGLAADRDVTIIQMQPKQLLDALHSGQIDAAMTNDPDATMAIARLNVEMLQPFYRGDVLPQYPSTCNLVNPRFRDAEPDKFRRIVRSLAEGIDAIEADPRGCLALLPGYIPIEAELATQVGVPTFHKFSSDLIPSFQILINLYAKSGVLDRELEASPLFIDDSEIRSAITKAATLAPRQ